MEAIGLGVLFIITFIVGVPITVGIYFFIRIKGWCAIVSIAFILFLIRTLILYEIESMESDIRYKSMLRFGVEAQYVDINFDILSAGKTPHSIVRKEGKAYYWSFQKNDFVFYYTYVKNGWEESTPESLEKLFNQYIFDKEEKK